MNKVLIWLGAGRVETPNINFDKFETVLLVEARLEQVAKLRKQYSKDSKVKIVHGAVSDLAQNSGFNRYSLEEYSAFSVATGLKELFPGLKVEEREEVNTQAIADVLNDYIAQPASITLVLDILDINHLILESLISVESWQNINTLYLPIPEISFYENAQPASELLSLLQSQGFGLSTIDSLDPDIPVAEMHRNPMWSELELVKKQLQLQKGQHQKEIQEYKSQLLAQNSDAEKAKRDFTQSLDKQSVELKKIVETNNKYKLKLEESNQQKTSLEKRLESDKLASETKIKQLQMDKQQLVETHGKAKEENEQQHQTLLSQIKTLTAQVERKTTKIELLVSTLETQKAESAKQFETLQAEKQQTESDIDELNTKFSVLKSEMASLKTELEERTQRYQESKKWTEGVNESNRELIKSIEALGIENKRLAIEKESLISELNVVKKRQSQTISTLELNTRLMTKLQSDTGHLREQFKEKVKSEEKLKALIAELHEKLQQAATFYHKLEQQYPDLLLESTESR
ncbi:hypothetical protein [Paraglaciecola marina]|uniref:hypothetical protein n=1 Tax=Paraglaciecola marina TaxID=2500157 RepID=UPI00105DBC86|nr:hypothetical protein [Paraglaciecola marina]